MVDKLQVQGKMCACGDHAFASITKGFVVIVSPVDAPLLSKPWHAKDNAGYIRVCRTERLPDGSRRHVPISRAILQTSDVDIVDHFNCNSLDNRRENLRVCDLTENNRNRRTVASRKETLPKGVYRMPSGRFFASIHAGVKIRLGTFDTPGDAHAAYVAAAKKYHCEFARLD